MGPGLAVVDPQFEGVGGLGVAEDVLFDAPLAGFVWGVYFEPHSALEGDDSLVDGQVLSGAVVALELFVQEVHECAHFVERVFFSLGVEVVGEVDVCADLEPLAAGNDGAQLGGNQFVVLVVGLVYTVVVVLLKPCDLVGLPLADLLFAPVLLDAREPQQPLK